MINQPSQPKLMNELTDSLTQAIGASAHMLHHQQNPYWIVLREQLEFAKGRILGAATFAATKRTVTKV